MASPTAFLVSETIRKDIVYSAECFDEGSKQLDVSTQLLVEYSVIALETKLMSPGETDYNEIIRYADASIDVINGCLKIGAFAFPPAAPVLLAIAGVGAFIQTLMKIAPDDRPNPVVEKYKELEKVVHQLEDQMVAHFADMQSFITEHNFNVNITTQSSTLMRFMRDCIQHQDEGDVENFSDAYEQNSPLSLAYSMASLLDNRSTNPLIMAMAAEKAKTKSTFNKWKTIITGIIGEFLFVETFASGLLNKTGFNRNKIVDQWNELIENLNQMENEYKNDQGYWAEFQKGFEDYISNHINLNNIEKANEIKEKLNNYLTYDAFYIFVFNDTVWHTDYTYYCKNETDQIIGSWHIGKCNAFVYRSRKCKEMDQDAYDSLQTQIMKIEDCKMTWNGTLKNVIKDQLLNQSLLTGYGFYCLMDPIHCDPQILFLNSRAPERLNKGPGHSTEIFMADKGGKLQFNFIVGFK